MALDHPETIESTPDVHPSDTIGYQAATEAQVGAGSTAAPSFKIVCVPAQPGFEAFVTTVNHPVRPGQFLGLTPPGQQSPTAFLITQEAFMESDNGTPSYIAGHVPQMAPAVLMLSGLPVPEDLLNPPGAVPPDPTPGLVAPLGHG